MMKFFIENEIKEIGKYYKYFDIESAIGHITSQKIFWDIFTIFSFVVFLHIKVIITKSCTSYRTSCLGKSQNLAQSSFQK